MITLVEYIVQWFKRKLKTRLHFFLYLKCHVTEKGIQFSNTFILVSLSHVTYRNNYE